MLAHWQIRSAILALFVLTCASAADNTNSSAKLPTYRSTVSEVRVTFFATDQNNHALETLSKADFAIVDNEHVVRSFRSFMHSDETSLDVIALVDMSESVAPRLRATINDLLLLLAREQSIPDDNISVLSFGGTSEGTQEGKTGGLLIQTSASLRPAVLCSSGCRASDSMSRLRAAKGSGATPLFDALIFGADFIAHHRSAGARQVLILFSDGNDTISLHSANDALRSALDEGALIYSVDMGGLRNQTSGRAFLQQVAEATGGRYFSPDACQKDGAAKVLNSILEDLRASYVVTYEPPSHQAGFHPLRLLPTQNLSLMFHSRNGYIYEPTLR